MIIISNLINKSAAQALRVQIAEADTLNRGQEIETEFIRQLDLYYASPASGFHDNALARKFYEQRLRHLKFTPYPNDGLVTFGASGTDKCSVEVFFRNQKVKPVKSDDIPFRGRQRSQGSAIIEYRQLDLIHMEKRLGDAAKFTVAETKNGEYAFEDAAQYRKVFEVEGVKFAITCKPDGIFKYGGDKLLFEFKTKASGIKPMNSKLDYKGADSSHLRQVTAESLVYGIREGIILYESNQKPSWFDDSENKSVTKGNKTWVGGNPVPDLRAFYFNITDDMQQALLTDLAKQAKIVYDGIKPDVTVESVDKCGFCQFQAHCKSEISPENLAELREIERGYAGSNFAGNADHRKLQVYLADVNEGEAV